MLDVLSLKVIAPNLRTAVGVLNVNPINYIRENHSQLLLTRMNLYLIHTVKAMQCYFIFYI